MSIDTLWYTRCPGPSAASIAIRQGWFEEEFAADGIAVRSLASSGDKAVHLSHYQHTQPNSFRFGGYVPPVLARARGSDVRVIGLAWIDRAAGLFALPGSPITGPGDLKGRRLGLPLRLRDGLDWWRGQVLAGFEQALHEAGLGFDDVTLVDIPVDRAYVEDVTTGTDQGRSLWGVRSQFALQREETAALIRGEVDAIYSDAALGALLRSFTGAQLVVPIRANQDEAEGDFGHPTVLTASGALIDERPDLVERWVGRLLDARDWALAHRSEARRIIANDSGLPEDLVELAHSPRLYEQLDVALDEGRIAIFRHKHDSLVRHGLLERPLDFDRFIDARPLQAVLAHRTRPVEAAA